MYEVEEKLPEFCKMIQAVINGEADAVVMNINAFAPEEADLFHKAMKYAYDKKVAVYLVPSGKLVKPPKYRGN